MHPTHVPVVNEVFTPSFEEIAFFKGLIETFEEAEKKGSAAVVYQATQDRLCHGQDRQGDAGLCRIDRGEGELGADSFIPQDCFSEIFEL